jgi:hypothetical protein
VNTSAFLAIATLVVATSGCSPDSRNLREVQRARSPNGLLTAAYVEDTGGGAAVGTGQDVYVFSGKTPTSYAERVFSEECVTDVRISWMGPKDLQISYGIRNGERASVREAPWWAFGKKHHHVRVHLGPHLASTYC